MIRDFSFYRPLPFSPVALFLLGIIFIMFSDPSTTRAQTLTEDRLGNGLSISVWNPQAQCPDVAPLIAVEIDPDRYRFTMHYYQQDGFSDPLDIRQWQEQTGHDLVFNAGLFRENYAYLGLLYGNGRSLGSKRHATWLGLFVAEPMEDRSRRARVLDLTFDSFDEQHIPYREVAQSLMLLDRTEKSVCAKPGNAHIRLLSQNKQWASSRPQDDGSGVTPCPWGMSEGRLSLPTPGHGHGWRILFRCRRQPLDPRSHV